MTIAGLYSVAELKDLIAAKDTELQTLATAAASFEPTWKASAPSTEAAWQTDYQNLLSRYSLVRAEAEATISAGEFTPLPDADIPADTQYHLVLGALQQTSGVVSPGDFQDIWDRLNAAIVATPSVSVNPLTQGPPVPQPGKGTDTDLSAYQTTDSITRALVTPSGDAGAGKPGWLLTAGVIGVVVYAIDRLVRGGSRS
jgi:hypothetical protein